MRALPPLLGLLLLAACGGRDEAPPAAEAIRAARRAYDGAPPVIPHQPLGIDCAQCHNARGMDVPGLGFAPPSPHEAIEADAPVAGAPPAARLAVPTDPPARGELFRCLQCHVFRRTTEVFRGSDFAGLPQVIRGGPRQHPLAPPRTPHPLAMRENCLACHAGPAARPGIVCSHPERPRCLQCHVPVTTGSIFER